MKYLRIFETTNERDQALNMIPYGVISYVETSGITIHHEMPNDEIWYTSIDGNIVRPASGIDTDMETGDSILIYDGPYNDIFGANIISNTYENGKGIIKFNGDVTKLEPSEDFIEHSSSSMFNEGEGYLNSRLTSINIPNSVTSIGGSAFYNCTNLISANIPNSVTSIGSDAFFNVLNVNYNGTATGSPWNANCINGYVENNIVYTNNAKTQLVGISKLYSGSITIPDSVISIGYYAFVNCTGLTSVNIPNSVTSIGDGAFNGCTGLTSINIPNSVINIGEYSFSDCTGLTSVNIPNSVTSIGYYAFAYCTGLTFITIPDSIISIENAAFQSCTGLTSITIPDSVTNIEHYAFSGCTGLTSINISSTTPPTLGIGAFDDTNNSPIYVPSDSVDAYKSSWSTYADRIQAIQS